MSSQLPRSSHSDLWVCQLGSVAYGDAVAIQEQIGLDVIEGASSLADALTGGADGELILQELEQAIMVGCSSV